MPHPASHHIPYASPETAESLAIVGIGCRLPGHIGSAAELLAALQNGRDCITEVPPDRWDVDAFYDPDPVTPGKTYVRKGGFVAEIDRFDAGFFGISDTEASRMDPQQRLVLETVWHALEDAGQSAAELAQSNTGVFLAMMNTNGYSQLKAMYEGLSGVTAYDAMGDAMSITAGRIAHFLGLEGPCFALDTACSSSLVALHLARQSILAGECDAAIVAGVSAILHPGIHMAFSKVGLMSRAGRCAAFDATADGYVRGEGCVAVLLRRQSLAQARGDNIVANIVGTAINQDGRTPAVTAPNGRAQEKVIRMALARTGITPQEIGYLEAHGTGTPVGDPIEMSAIVNVYGPERAAGETLYVGSVKSNFGHIEAGAGLLGLAKAALSLQQEQIFPSLHFSRLNPNIDLNQAPVEIPTDTIAWPRHERPRLAGVNSFGYSGTNAHAILQEAPLPTVAEESKSGRPAEMVLLSAKTAERLAALADQWRDFLAQDDAPPLADIAFTAATGRTHLPHRLAIVGSSREEMNKKLDGWRNGRRPKGLFVGQVSGRRKPKIAFMFTGQGAQYAGMGQKLYQTEARFAAAIDRCATFMDDELGAPLTEILFGETAADYLDNTRYVQPALFAIEYALADLLAHWGVEPDYVIGHSVGEIVAACVAGMLDLEDAATFVLARGRLMGDLPPGGKMLATDGTLAEAQAWIAGKEADVSIATVNGPRAVVIAGRAAAIDEVAQLAQAAGKRTKELDVSHAFHSPLMEPILDELTAVANSLHLSPPRIPIISNVTGQFLSDDVSGDYWSAHVRQAVRFHQGMAQLVEAGCSLVVEVGPHPALTPAVATAFDPNQVQTIPTLRRDQKDMIHILESLAALHTSGVTLNLDQLFWSPLYRRVHLPLYPFRRERHWLASDKGFGVSPRLAETAVAAPAPAEEATPAEPLTIDGELHPLLGEVTTADTRRVVFTTTLSTTTPWTDHRVLGSTVFPATAYMEMAARAFAACTGQNWQSVAARDLVYERPFLLKYGKTQPVSLTLENPPVNGNDDSRFVIAAADEPAEVFCRGRLVLAANSQEQIPVEGELVMMRSQLEIGPFYGELRKGGLEYGAGFANVRELWLGEPGSGEALGRVTASPNGGGANESPFANAVLLDGCLQVFGAALRPSLEDGYGGAFVPAAIESVTLYRPLPAEVWSQVKVQTSANGQAALAHIRVLSNEGDLLAEMNGIELRQTNSLTNPGAVPRPTPSSNGANLIASRGELLAKMGDLPRPERITLLTKWLAAEVKDTMGQAAEGLDLDTLDPSTAFLEIGLDSLLVTELQRRIQEKLDFRFQPMQGLDYQSIESLAEFIYEEVLMAEGSSQ